MPAAPPDPVWNWHDQLTSLLRQAFSSADVDQMRGFSAACITTGLTMARHLGISIDTIIAAIEHDQERHLNDGRDLHIPPQQLVH